MQYLIFIKEKTEVSNVNKNIQKITQTHYKIRFFLNELINYMSGLIMDWSYCVTRNNNYQDIYLELAINGIRIALYGYSYILIIN